MLTVIYVERYATAMTMESDDCYMYDKMFHELYDSA